MEIKFHVISNESDGHGGRKIIEFDEVKDFSETADRDEHICIICGYPNYPKCKEWCQNMEFKREREKERS